MPRGYIFRSIPFEFPGTPAQSPACVYVGDPPCTESRFARARRYHAHSHVQHGFSWHYPAFIALTSSCARPASSARFWYPNGPCGLLRAPAANWSFPTLSPQSVESCLDPYPATFDWCFCPFLPNRHRPNLIHERCGTWIMSCNAILCRRTFRGCSHSFMFRPLSLLDPLIAPTEEQCAPQQRGRLHHAMNVRLPARTVISLRARLRTVGAAGLAPARLWPCRPLPVYVYV